MSWVRIPPEQLFFLFGEKRVVWVSCLPLFSIYRKEFSWEKRVTKVAKTVIGEKTVVCGSSTRWWDEEIKGKIKQRREVSKRFRHNGDSKLWTEYCKLRKEVSS